MSRKYVFLLFAINHVLQVTMFLNVDLRFFYRRPEMKFSEAVDTGYTVYRKRRESDRWRTLKATEKISRIFNVSYNASNRISFEEKRMSNYRFQRKGRFQINDSLQLLKPFYVTCDYPNLGQKKYLVPNVFSFIVSVFLNWNSYSLKHNPMWVFFHVNHSLGFTWPPQL